MGTANAIRNEAGVVSNKIKKVSSGAGNQVEKYNFSISFLEIVGRKKCYNLVGIKRLSCIAMTGVNNINVIGNNSASNILRVATDTAKHVTNITNVINTISGFESLYTEINKSTGDMLIKAKNISAKIREAGQGAADGIIQSLGSEKLGQGIKKKIIVAPLKNPMKKDKVEDQVNSANENPSVNPGGQLIKKTNDAVKEIITSGEQLIKKIKSSLKPSGNRSSSVAVKGNQDQMKIATGELDKRSKEIIKEIKEMVNTFVPLSFIEKKVENISFLFVNSGNEVKENVGTLVAKIKEDFQDFKKAVEKFVDVVKKVGTLAAP